MNRPVFATPIRPQPGQSSQSPVTSCAGSYVPINRPAIGDLMSLFRFDRVQDAKDQLQAVKEKVLTSAQRAF